jgi:hypothetical protein
MKNDTSPVLLERRKEAEARQECEGLAWCERLSGKLDRKRGQSKPGRGRHAHRD